MSGERGFLSHISRRQCLFALSASLASASGCGRLLHQTLPPAAPPTLTVNPAMLPQADRSFIWQQVVDTVDDYFRIAEEQPLSDIANGSLKTTFQIGASALEPWRRDSTRGFERLQSTLQTIAREATVDVRPRPDGYSIEVVVRKFIEDVDRSQGTTGGSIATRHDGTVTRADEIFDGEPTTLGWIPLGRDTSLEQVILNEIIDRITKADRPTRLLHH